MGFLSYMKPAKANAQEKKDSKFGLKKPESQDEGSGSIPLESVTPSFISQDSSSGEPPSSSTDPTPSVSRPISLYPGAEFGIAQSNGSQGLLDIKCDVMVNWLYQQQMERLWTAGGQDEGVVLKKSRGVYTCCPEDIIDDPHGFVASIQALNVRVALTVNTRVIKSFLRRNDKPYVPLKLGLRLQVLPDVTYLPRCQKHQFAAFIADRGLLIVWDDEPKHILDRASKIEKALLEMVWDDGTEEEDEDKDSVSILPSVSGLEVGAVERGTVEKPRPISLLNPILSGFTMFLTTLALGASFAKIALEISVDHFFLRVAFVAALPAQIWLALFFFQALVTSIAQIIGPVSQMKENTKFYSGVRPRRLRRDAGPLPHLTVQMPVYKEGLQSVIEPTIHSIKAAISTYEMQGGTANIFVNDDGMQLVSAEDAQARQDFYDEHNIGWVARPKHNPKPKDGENVFLRRGKFKKASNMNYAMWVSNRVEDKLKAIERHSEWTQENEAKEYQKALMEVVESDEGRTQADGNIRIGDYILIIDSDTRVPTDCFLDCVSEMEQCPQVAVLQYASGVMNVTDSFFERGITFFTNLIYTQIRYAVATGDVAPFVGHNAVLRWSAMQDVGYDCKDDHREKFWSEDTVSEDFDMSLRLQSTGFVVRLGAYTGDGFQEGVSLTVYDELARWEKYAYGCSELIFHPIRYWFTRGPFTTLFIRFLKSGMPLPSKITMMAYVGTYYALASAWILTLTNYFLTGWLNGHLDHYYLDSFKIYFSIILVFTALGNLSLAVLRYRVAEKGFFSAYWETLSWIPLLSIFLGGISIHVSQAILSHLFSVDMSWGATSKEAEDTTFFAEVPKIIKKFKVTFVFCIVCTAMMIVMARFAPPLWRIDLFISIWPMGCIIFGHFFLPIALNPGLMRFTW